MERENAQDQAPPQAQAEALTISGSQSSRGARIEAAIDADRANLDIVAGKQRSRGQLFDWVKPESQLPDGVTPPPLPPPLWELEGKTRAEVMTPEMERLLMGVNAQLTGPNGTVPRWRPDADYVSTKATTLNDFFASVNNPDPAICPPNSPGYCRHYQQVTAFGSFWGTAAFLNIWNPVLDATEPGRMSLMQFAAANVGADGLKDTLEVGWMVQPQLFQDSSTHLFLFLTPDGYQTSCWNSGCNGWYQISSTKAPGMVLPASVLGGNQVEALTGVLAQPGWYYVWWGDEWIGAVPATYYDPNAGTTFDGLAGGIATASWYGEVADAQDASHVMTATDMGSGQFVAAGVGSAAYIRDLVTSPDASTWDPFYNNSYNFLTSNFSCYDNTYGRQNDGVWNDWFALGGPGYNWPNCTTDN